MATFRPLSLFSNYPSKFIYLRSCHSLFFLLVFLISVSSSHSFISYSDHCNHIVPESPIDHSPSSVSNRASLAFDISFFSGGETFFSRNQHRNGDIKSARFRPRSVRKTLGDGKVYKVEARLNLQIMKTSNFASNYAGDLGLGKLQVTEVEGRRIGVKSRGRVSFDFSGFWSESTGQICMVGSTKVVEGTDLKSFDARLILQYGQESNVYGSLVKGVLESVGNQSSFETISILSVKNPPMDYEYKLLEKSECGINSEESSSIDTVWGGVCNAFHRNTMHGMVFRTECGSKNTSCSPLGTDIEYKPPGFMSVLTLICAEDRMRMLLSFSNTSSFGRRFSFYPSTTFDPSTTLVAEGAWDVDKNRFCGVACRVMNFSDSLSNAVVGDCSLRLSMRFPAVLSIKRMAPVVGMLWSAKTESDPSYFSEIEFSSLNPPLWLFPGLRYEYTESEKVNKLCGGRKSLPKSKVKRYPDAQTSDMRFFMSVKYSGSSVLRTARASPDFVGDRLSRDLLVRGQGAGLTGFPTHVNDVTNRLTNITYRIRFMNSVSESRDDIYAEGTYDRDTGDLCMVGCHSVRLKSTVEMRNETVDCSLIIKIKFSPVHSNSNDRLRGTIESTREKTDPLYVEHMEVFSRSIYDHQAKDSVWRMDLEVAMVLISNTLSCVFVGIQLYHVKKHPETLPFISITMLILLTLGHMIPLLLNFEELFKSSHNQPSLFFDYDRWLEAKEIVVRIVTMIAFLLECRLLQQAWTARKTEEHHYHGVVWNAEKKVFYVCLPLYITGGLIAWIVNRNRAPRRIVFLGKPRARNLLYRPVNLKRSFQRPPLWKDLKSYGGLMLDAFLLPQILFNGFSNSDSKALAGLFYGGNSIVRLLPHAYDLYRSRSYGKILDWSFIYANHKMDYYSTAWDIVILCIGFLFAFLIFLQQRFGSRYFIPKRFKDNVGYEKVVELQQTA